MMIRHRCSAPRAGLRMTSLGAGLALLAAMLLLSRPHDALAAPPAPDTTVALPPPELTAPDLGAPHTTRFAPGRVLVRLAPPPAHCAADVHIPALTGCWPLVLDVLHQVGLDRLLPLHPSLPAATPRRTSPLDRAFVALVDANADIPALVERLLHTPGVELASPDWIGFGAAPLSPPPDDPAFADQWALEQPSDADIDILAAWAVTRGDANVVIAVLDTGLEFDHADFAPERLHLGYDFVNDDDDPRDDLGHGTHVASIAAAGADDGVGIAGICPQCSLLPIKVLDSNNEGFYSWWIAGLTYAVDHGASVINLSAGGATDSELLRDAVRYAHAHDVPVVAAMMNFAHDMPWYPAAWPETIAVGATDQLDRRAEPFDFGSGGSNFGPHIELVAPGDRILGALIRSSDRITELDGTSQAVPMVSGTLGLLRALDPTLGLDDLRTILARTAVDRVGRPEEDVAGFDPYHGHGRLSAGNAVRSLVFPDDIDGDGVTVADGDCDDLRDTTYPGAPELANGGHDDDCDPSTPDPVDPIDPEPDSDTGSDTSDSDTTEMDEDRQVAGGGGGCCAVVAAPARAATAPVPLAWLLMLAASLVALLRRR